MTSFNKTDIDYASLKQAASHYKGEGNYCSVISLCISTGCKFGKGRSILAKELGRINNRGTYGESINHFGRHMKGQHDYVYPKLGKKVVELPMGRGFMISNSASRLPRHGTFLIYSSRHVTCLKDGIVHDWCVEPVPEGYKRKDKRMVKVFQVLDA